MGFVVTEAGELFHQAADLVKRSYAQWFGASVHGHPSSFVVAQDEQTGRVQACVGVNHGIGRPFFMEYYLPVSAEEVVTIHTGIPVPRRRIVEFGPIASAVPGAGRELLKSLPSFGLIQGQSYALGTATRELAAVLRYLRLPFEPLSHARRDQLPPDEWDGWGSYYQHEPVNGLIRLDRAIAALGIARSRRATITPPPAAPITATLRPTWLPQATRPRLRPSD